MLGCFGAGGGVIDGDLWWASTGVTTVVGSGVIGKHFTANHYDYTYVYSYDYITQNGTNRIGIICPDGWRLPTTNEQVALLKASGFTGSYQNTSAGYHANINGTGKNGRWFGPGVATGGSDASKYTYTTDTHIFIPYAGENRTTINNAPGNAHLGTLGHIWSSIPSGSFTAYSLRLESSIIYPHWSYSKAFGYPVRCVAEPL